MRSPPKAWFTARAAWLRAEASTYIRERARERGLTLRQVADRTGLSYGYVTFRWRGDSAT